MFSPSPTAKMWWQDQAGIATLSLNECFQQDTPDDDLYVWSWCYVIIFTRYTWPSGRWEEATYVMGVKQGRGVEVTEDIVLYWMELIGFIQDCLGMHILVFC